MRSPWGGIGNTPFSNSRIIADFQEFGIRPLLKHKLKIEAIGVTYWSRRQTGSCKSKGNLFNVTQAGLPT